MITNIKVFGTIFIPAFVLLASVSTQTPDQVVTTKHSRIEAETRITSEEYDDVKNLSSVQGKAFAEGFQKTMLWLMRCTCKKVIDVKVTDVRNGSVIVQYYLVLNTTSEAEAARVANAITEAVNSGAIGSYKTDRNFKPEAYITRKVKSSEVSTAPDPKTTTLSTALLVTLIAALFILLIIIVLLVTLVCCLLKLKRKGENSNQ